MIWGNSNSPQFLVLCIQLFPPCCALPPRVAVELEKSQTRIGRPGALSLEWMLLTSLKWGSRTAEVLHNPLVAPKCWGTGQSFCYPVLLLSSLAWSVVSLLLDLCLQRFRQELYPPARGAAPPAEVSVESVPATEWRFARCNLMAAMADSLATHMIGC